MISRLFLNLRAEPVAYEATYPGASTFRCLWSNVVGNLGAQLDSGIEFAIPSPRSVSSEDVDDKRMMGVREMYLEDRPWPRHDMVGIAV